MHNVVCLAFQSHIGATCAGFPSHLHNAPSSQIHISRGETIQQTAAPPLPPQSLLTRKQPPHP